ncbi:MAG TPA: hypothetical protein VIS55_16900 [Pseudomonadales bacterium]
MDINWEAVGAIGEIVGAVAVVLTLGYLAVQIRQNTNASRAQSYQAVVDGHVGHHRTFTSDPKLIEIFGRGLQDIDILDDLERGLFHSLVAPIVLQYQKYLYLYRAGMLPPDTFDMFERDVIATLITPGGRAWWLSSKGKWPEISNHLDQRIEDLQSEVVPSHEDFGGHYPSFVPRAIAKVISGNHAHTGRLFSKAERLVEANGVVRLKVDVLTRDAVNQHSHDPRGNTLTAVVALCPHVDDISVPNTV